jgi:hypothetical protein
MYLFNRLTALLPTGLQPYAKAVYPALGTIVGVAVQWIATGEFDRAETVTAISGAIAALLAYAPPNRPLPR